MKGWLAHGRVDRWGDAVPIKHIVLDWDYNNFMVLDDDSVLVFDETDDEIVLSGWFSGNGYTEPARYVRSRESEWSERYVKANQVNDSDFVEGVTQT